MKMKKTPDLKMIYLVLICKSLYFNVNVGVLLIMFDNYTLMIIILFYCGRLSVICGKLIKLNLTCDSVQIILSSF